MRCFPNHVLGALCLCLSFWACQPSETPLLRALPPTETGIRFQNQLFESDRLNIITWEYFYNGGGVGIGDINNDSLPDLFFSANMLESKLYLNVGNFQFKDITQSAGISTRGQWAQGVSMVDLNADGLLDIYVSMAGPYPPEQRTNRLFINLGNQQFEERAAQYGLADTGHTTQTAFFDYDRDGDLDAYLLTNMMEVTGPNVIRPKKLDGSSINTDRLYRNDGGTFVDVSAEAGILKEGYGLGVSICDLNQDGWPDVYVSNDYLSNDLLYLNQGDGTFVDEAAACFKHTSYSAMGHDVADVNGDGLLDLLTVDMLPTTSYRQKMMFGSINYDRFQSETRAGYAPQFMRNTLQLNQGTGPDGRPLFAEVGQLTGMHSTDWSWASLLVDLDQDGWRDVFITNGYPRDITNRDFVDYKSGALFGREGRVKLGELARNLASLEGIHLPNVVFQNRGDLKFVDRSEGWGVIEPTYSHGLAYGDLDGDGDLDLVANNLEGPASVYENTAERLGHHRLQLQFQGTSPNLAGIGARVWAWSQGGVQYAEHQPVRGYQSCMQPGLWLGLGQAKGVDSLRVVWPDGSQQVRKNLSADKPVVLKQTDAHLPGRKEPAPPPALVKMKNLQAGGMAVTHIDPAYVDFKVQPLLPHKHSQQGPHLAVGDANGDGLEDLFVGGAFQQAGRLFLQQADGSFSARTLGEAEAISEDLGSTFLDADQDGDLDLYVCSGSSEFVDTSRYYQDRLYLNDGQGHFSLAPDALPALRTSTSVVVAADYDQDGDDDLFVGGRLTPHAYPRMPRSYLLQNQGGTFVDVTAEQAPALLQPGMVTDALWTDLNQDEWPDLVVVGEWMPITIFQSQAGQFPTTSKTVLPASEGWWNSLAQADMDGDGDLDLVAGNLGLNSRLKASGEAPLSLYVKDFNQDAKLDAVLCHFLQGEEVPFHPKDDMVKQMLNFRRKFPTYEDYARASWRDLFSPEERDGMRVLKVHELQSVYLQNLGGGQFELQPLPLEAQFAPVQAILPHDLNADGKLDLLLVGNSHVTEVQTGPYDALNGLVLLGDGTGQFRPLSVSQSGFYVPGDARSLAIMTLADGRLLLVVGQNSGPLLVAEPSTPDALVQLEQG